MSKAILLGMLLAVIGVQPRLFAPPPISEMRSVAVALDEVVEDDVAEEAGEGDVEAQGEGEEGDYEEVVEAPVSRYRRDREYEEQVYAALNRARMRLSSASDELRTLAELYADYGYNLSSGSINNIYNELYECVQQYNEFDKYNGTILELKTHDREED